MNQAKEATLALPTPPAARASGSRRDCRRLRAHHRPPAAWVIIVDVGRVVELRDRRFAGGRDDQTRRARRRSTVSVFSPVMLMPQKKLWGTERAGNSPAVPEARP